MGGCRAMLADIDKVLKQNMNKRRLSEWVCRCFVES
jgi:hypothetical protein